MRQSVTDRKNLLCRPHFGQPWFKLLQSAIQILSNPSMSTLLEEKTGMIASKQSWQKQRVVIEFLLLDGETAQHKQKAEPHHAQKSLNLSSLQEK